MRNVWLALIVVVLLVPVATYAGKGGGSKTPKTDVKGALDTATCSTGTAKGWAQDTNTPNQGVVVYFWIDSEPDSYTSTAGSVGYITANEYRADLCTALGSCEHGFTFAIPPQYLDGNPNSIYAYGKDTGSSNGTQLAGFPKQFECYPPPSFQVTFDQNPISYGGNTTVRWSSQLATSMYINTIGYVPANTSGSATVYGSNLGANSCATSNEQSIKPIVITRQSGTTWPVPSDWNSSSNAVEVWGGGGGGGSDNGSATASAGGRTTFNTTLIGNGGARGGNEGAIAGLGGTASGGNVNTRGSEGERASGTSFGGAGGNAGGTEGGAGAPRRAGLSGAGTGFSGYFPGGGGGGGWTGSGSKHGAGGGGGGYAKKNNMNLTPGSSISYSIGAGGTGSSNGTHGGNGAGGKIVITYTPAGATPTCYVGVDYSCTVQGTDTLRTNAVFLSVSKPPPPIVNISAASSIFPLGSSTTVTATFSGSEIDPLVNDNIDSPEGTGLGASIAPEAIKSINFSPQTTGTHTLFARVITNFYTTWKSFASTTVTVVDPPVCTISFDSNPIPQGLSTTLRWSSSNADSFFINAIGSVTPDISGSTTVSPSQATDYTGTVTAFAYSVMCKAITGIPLGTLNVLCTPSYSCSDSQTILYTAADCATTQTACASPSFCSAGSAVCLYPQPSFIGGTGGSGLTGHLQVRPEFVRAGNAGKVYWNVDNVSACSVSGEDGNYWTGVTSGSSGRTTDPIFQQTTFTLTCQALPGVAPASFSETATLNIVPVFREI